MKFLLEITIEEKSTLELDRTESKSRKLVKKIKIENKKREEAIAIAFTLIEDEQQFYDFKLRSVGPAFANASDRLIVFSFFAEKDLDPLVRQIRKNQASIFRRINFVY